MPVVDVSKEWAAHASSSPAAALSSSGTAPTAGMQNGSAVSDDPACDCEDLTPQERLAQSTIAFTGTVEEVESGKKGKLVIVFDVDEIFKGTPGLDAKVTAEVAGNACDLPFKVNQSYLVFAHWEWGSMMTSRCMGTKFLEKARVAALGPDQERKEKLYIGLPNMLHGPQRHVLLPFFSESHAPKITMFQNPKRDAPTAVFQTACIAAAAIPGAFRTRRNITKMHTPIDQLNAMIEKIERAAIRSGRYPRDLTLLAVTKTVPFERVAPFLRAGVRNVGENRVQEAIEKFAAMPPPNPVFHLIGPLQSNKAKKAAQFFDMIQTLDRWELAEDLNRHAGDLGKVLDCLVQVKISDEPTKSGLDPSALSVIHHSRRDTSQSKSARDHGDTAALRHRRCRASLFLPSQKTLRKFKAHCPLDGYEFRLRSCHRRRLHHGPPGHDPFWRSSDPLTNHLTNT